MRPELPVQEGRVTSAINTVIGAIISNGMTILVQALGRPRLAIEIDNPPLDRPIDPKTATPAETTKNPENPDRKPGGRHHRRPRGQGSG